MTDFEHMASQLKGKLLRNTIFSMITLGIVQFSKVVLFMIIVRTVGSEETGAYALAMKYTALLLPISSLGLNHLAMRDVARDRSLTAPYLVNTGILRLLSSLCAYAVLWFIVTIIFDYSTSTTHLILFFGLMLIPENFNFMCQSLFTAHEKQEYETLLRGFVTIGGFIFSLFLLWRGYRLWGVFAGMISVSVLGAGLGLWLVRWRLLAGFAARLDLRWTWEQVKLTFLFQLMIIFYMMDWQLDVIILSAFRPQEEVTWYYAPQTVLIMFYLLTDVYGKVILPVLSRLYVTDKDKAGKLHNRSFLYIAMIALPLAMTVAIFRHEIMQVLGPDFPPYAANVLGVLMIVFAIGMLNDPNSRMVIAADKQGAATLLLAWSMGVNIAANLLFIPRWGMWGATLARVISVGTFGIINSWYVYRHIHRFAPPRELLSLIAIVALTSGTMLGLQRVAPWWLAVISGGCIYLCLLLVTNVIPDWREWWSLVYAEVGQYRSPPR